ncbi:MAG: protein translocase subunit SecD [Deltaproteobacteria bacterium]|nr:MAG: protein translocase subunit SecD [Deltaproteobacteria bacterium]
MRRFLKLKALLLAALVALSVLQVLPSVAEVTGWTLPSWISERFDRKFKLGLDLQGGLHLEYSVAVDEAIENKLDQVAAELEAAFREKKDIEAKVVRKGIDRLEIHFPRPEDVQAATDDVMGITFGLLERVDPPEGEPGPDQGVLHLAMPEQVLEENRRAAVAQALEIVRRRVDAMGIAEPNIYPKNRQIVVELPGLADESTELRAASQDVALQVRKLLEEAGIANVQVTEVRGDPGAFRLVLPDRDARAEIEKLFAGSIVDGRLIDDERLRYELEILEGSPEDAADPEVVVLGFSEAARDAVLESSGDFRRLLKIIERQAVLQMHLVDDETPFRGTGVPYLRALYEAGMVTKGMGISVNVEPDYGREGGVTVKDPYAFYAKDRETLEHFFAQLPAKWRLPSTHKVAFGPVQMVLRRGEEPVTVWRTYVIKARAEVTGEHIVNATVGFNQQTGQPEVNLKLDRIGADLFEKMSGANVGRKMAIILDEVVYSDPIFNERIPGGNVRITLGATPGQSPREAANDLVKVLKSGSLPARLQKEFEMRVGADLGRDSVERGFRAFVYGLVAVVLFMVVYYRISGVVAAIALVLNMLFILAAMALFQATLTLPGMAGVVLTIGMAVDANVIVFERIRDYIREGYTARAAVDSGYDRAFTTILDSQLTTAIAGIVLWQYGSGPIRGFAITLLIGIATSIFTGVFCSRLFFDFQTNRRGFEKVSI